MIELKNCSSSLSKNNEHSLILEFEFTNKQIKLSFRELTTSQYLNQSIQSKLSLLCVHKCKRKWECL